LLLRVSCLPAWFLSETLWRRRIHKGENTYIYIYHAEKNPLTVLPFLAAYFVCSHDINRLALCNDDTDDRRAPMHGLHPAIASSVPGSRQICSVCKFLDRGNECQPNVELRRILSGTMNAFAFSLYAHSTALLWAEVLPAAFSVVWWWC
jgi:hypothetical protein